METVEYILEPYIVDNKLPVIINRLVFDSTFENGTPKNWKLYTCIYLQKQLCPCFGVTFTQRVNQPYGHNSRTCLFVLNYTTQLYSKILMAPFLSSRKFLNSVRTKKISFHGYHSACQLQIQSISYDNYADILHLQHSKSMKVRLRGQNKGITFYIYSRPYFHINLQRIRATQKILSLHFIHTLCLFRRNGINRSRPPSCSMIQERHTRKSQGIYRTENTVQLRGVLYLVPRFQTGCDLLLFIHEPLVSENP